jgi:tripartite-type tricarboxylate transporter receptor subunit TctC
MQSPEMRNRLHEGGWRIVTLSSAQTETFLKSEADRWIPLLRRARVTVE